MRIALLGWGNTSFDLFLCGFFCFHFVEIISSLGFFFRLDESKETEYDHRQKDASYVSMSSDHLGKKYVLVTQSSQVPADAVESPIQMSPTTTSQHISTAESANFIQNSGGSSPNHSQQKITVSATIDEEKLDSAVPQRPKAAGKLSTYAVAHVALSSFEEILGSLTRTKESIGRATRIAIDCAKFGVSSKVGCLSLDPFYIKCYLVILIIHSYSVVELLLPNLIL